MMWLVRLLDVACSLSLLKKKFGEIIIIKDKDLKYVQTSICFIKIMCLKNISREMSVVRKGFYTRLFIWPQGMQQHRAFFSIIWCVFIKISQLKLPFSRRQIFWGNLKILLECQPRFQVPEGRLKNVNNFVVRWAQNVTRDPTSISYTDRQEEKTIRWNCCRYYFQWRLIVTVEMDRVTRHLVVTSNFPPDLLILFNNLLLLVRLVSGWQQEQEIQPCCLSVQEAAPVPLPPLLPITQTVAPALIVAPLHLGGIYN